MFDEKQRKNLKDIARRSIETGLKSGQPLTIDLDDYEDALREKAATFVTLNIDGNLRGCIGILVPMRPLVEDVAYNAFAAAYRDSRFNPAHEEEIEKLEIHISVLGIPEKLSFGSEEELLRQIRPNVDGLILEDGGRRSTFLPSVWEQLPDKKDFISHLKQKAGFPGDYWSDSIIAQRYQVESF